MKGFDTTSGDPFKEPFIAYHLQRAKAGDYDSARWLRDNAKKALAAGTPVDPHIQFAAEQMRKGGLRKSLQQKKRGDRGKGLGDHNQMLSAREMWKQINLARLPIREAARIVSVCFSQSASSVINAYYRFAKTKDAEERRAFLVELSRDYQDHSANWGTLAKSPDILSHELEALTKLPSF